MYRFVLLRPIGTLSCHMRLPSLRQVVSLPNVVAATFASDCVSEVCTRSRRRQVGQHALAIVAAGQDAQRPRLHRAELAGVDEQGFAFAVAAAFGQVLAGLVAGQEPEAGGDAGCEE